jgi:hypothetical protein
MVVPPIGGTITPRAARHRERCWSRLRLLVGHHLLLVQCDKLLVCCVQYGISCHCATLERRASVVQRGAAHERDVENDIKHVVIANSADADNCAF